MSDIAQMTPEELTAAGIPVEVALQARITEAVVQVNEARRAQDWRGWASWSIRERERRDALAIIEAKR